MVLAAAGAAWAALGESLPSGSERFYLIVPPTFLGLFAVLASGRRATLLKRLPAALLVVAYLGVFVWAVVSFLRGDWRPGWRTAGEIATAVYFLLSVGLLVGTVRWGLRGLCDRLSHALPVGSRRRGLVREGLPAVLLALAAAPYLIAAGYVHRVKLPAQHDPRQLLHRPFDDVTFQSEDGLTIRGWFLPAAQPSSRTVLICHGLGGNREMFLCFSAVADHLGANTLIFDFRGHGDSDGHTVTLGLGEKRDVRAAIDYLRRERAEQCRELYGLGVSMGSGALILAAAELEQPLDGLILDSGMACALDLTDSILQAVPSSMRPWLAGPGVPLLSLHAGCRIDDLRPEARISHVRAPVFVVHSTGDRLIPPAHGERLYRSAVDRKELFLAATPSHADVFHYHRDEYLRRISNFFDASVASREQGIADLRFAMAD